MPLEGCSFRNQVATGRARQRIVDPQAGHGGRGAAAKTRLHGDVAGDVEIERGVVHALARCQRADAPRDVVVALERDGAEAAAHGIASHWIDAGHPHAQIELHGHGQRVETRPQVGYRGGDDELAALERRTRVLDAQDPMGGPIRDAHVPLPLSRIGRSTVGATWKSSRAISASAVASVAGAHGSIVTTNALASLL